ncbi:MAG: SDR family NAD(P)-dependent oxidoreductase [Gammaproteobacteria bacterium]|nr:SDR family NAD(P)-dependent oxidoreductase [Gammaproteobacteria bacterium]
MREFRGGVAVVTGAAGGIGRALARQCVAEGMQVVLADLQPDPLHSLAAELAAAGASVIAVPTDVARADQVAALAETAFAQCGRVDLLFNNAGVLISGYSWERPIADWQWILNINLMGVVHGIHSFVPRMLAQNSPGHIVNTSSVAGLLASPLMGPYTVSKQAVVALTETLHYELQGIGALLKTSVLCPGPIATGIADSGLGRSPGHTASPDANAQFMGFLRAGIAAGMAPADCADRVFQGIRQEQFWIFTHDDFKPGYEARCASVLAGSNPLYEPFSI